MQYKLQNDCCGEAELLILQEQGESSPVIIILGYDITDVDFECVINFPAPLTLGVGTGITVLDVPTGKIQMQLTSAQTENIPVGQYKFDFWSFGQSNVNINFLSGFFVINTSLVRIP